jgi:hypothetical protein
LKVFLETLQRRHRDRDAAERRLNKGHSILDERERVAARNRSATSLTARPQIEKRAVPEFRTGIPPLPPTPVSAVEPPIWRSHPRLGGRTRVLAAELAGLHRLRGWSDRGEPDFLARPDRGSSPAKKRVIPINERFAARSCVGVHREQEALRPLMIGRTTRASRSGEDFPDVVAAEKRSLEKGHSALVAGRRKNIEKGPR